MRLYALLMFLCLLPVGLQASDGKSGASKVKNDALPSLQEDDLIPEKVRIELPSGFDFIESVYKKTTHVGILKYICKYTNRYYGEYMRADREAYTAISLHPYYAEKRYDQMISRVYRRVRVESPKKLGHYFSFGRIALGRDMRLRLDDTPRIRSSRLSSPRDLAPVYKTRFRLRARINVKVSNSAFGLKTIGVRMNGVFVNKRGKNLPINIFMTAKHKLTDNSTLIFVGISV